MEFITRKKLASYRNLCRQDHAAILAFAESGKTITDHHIENVLSEYRNYLLKLKIYAMDRRREIKHKEKKEGNPKHELTDSGREAGQREKLPYSDDAAATS